MKKQTAYLISSAIAALFVGGVFAASAIAAGYTVNYLYPDRPGAVLLSGAMAGLVSIWCLGWIAKGENEQYEEI